MEIIYIFRLVGEKENESDKIIWEIDDHREKGMAGMQYSFVNMTDFGMRKPEFWSQVFVQPGTDNLFCGSLASCLTELQSI